MNEDHEAMINDCADHESRLTTWEADFIVSLQDRLGAERELSERQAEVLEKIWNKVTK